MNTLFDLQIPVKTFDKNIVHDYLNLTRDLFVTKYDEIYEIYCRHDPDWYWEFDNLLKSIPTRRNHMEIVMINDFTPQVFMNIWKSLRKMYEYHKHTLNSIDFNKYCFRYLYKFNRRSFKYALSHSNAQEYGVSGSKQTFIEFSNMMIPLIRKRRYRQNIYITNVEKFVRKYYDSEKFNSIRKYIPFIEYLEADYLLIKSPQNLFDLISTNFDENKWIRDSHTFDIDPANMPFNYDDVIHSPYWFGPPIATYYGPRSVVKPGIVKHTTFVERLRYFMGERTYAFLRDTASMYTAPDPVYGTFDHDTSLNVTGSAMTACGVLNVPIPNMSWQQWVNEHFADSDLDIVMTLGSNYDIYLGCLDNICKRLTDSGGEIVEIINTAVCIVPNGVQINDDMKQVLFDEYVARTNLDIKRHNFLFKPTINDKTGACVIFSSFPRYRICAYSNRRIKIRFPGERVVEIFNTSDLHNTIERFHLPCVRAFWAINKPTPYITAHYSYYLAMMTGCNMDYKYFAAVRSPMEIIRKYALRGFGTLLNESEWAEYCAIYGPHMSEYLRDDVSEQHSIYHQLCQVDENKVEI